MWDDQIEVNINNEAEKQKNFSGRIDKIRPKLLKTDHTNVV